MNTWPGRATSSFECIVLAAGVLLGGLGMASLLGAESTGLQVAGLGVIAAAVYALATRQLRRPLLAAVFFLAPVDISKAIISPLTSLYFPAGPYYSPGLYLTLSHMALLALLVAWLGHRALLERRWPPMTRLDWLALGFMVFIWIRSFGAAQGLLSLGSAAAYSLAVIGFYVASHTIRDTSDVRLVVKASLAVLLLSIVYVALQAITQSPLTLPGSKGLAFGASVDFGGGVSTYRPSGFMNHPNSLAHYLVIVLPPAMALCLLGPARIPPSAWWMAAVTALGGAMVLLITLSRGGWASAALATFVIVAVYVRKGLVSRPQLALMFMALIACALVVVALYPAILLRLTAPDNRSLESRVLLADMAFTIIQANPFAGVGFGDYNRAAFEYATPLFANVTEAYQQALHQLVVHNHFLLVAAELGIPAMLLFVYLLWRFVRLPWPLSRWQDHGTFAIAIGLSAAVVGEALFFNSDNYYVDIRVYLFWLAAGVLQALTLQADRERTT
ncbi:O-antigen ligase family protein [Variovorax sp. dw_954]|uniref:O-antigen ligase family protein n=1 Tax=Variovorax sp. dw_954 TaxID=2720078 RepID=UPI001BD47AE5|nr:O-antigen ligase family protein [Variovorax sp. dw_954]